MSTDVSAVTAPRSLAAGSLLTAGAVGGPLFLTVVLAQAYTRNGFDPSIHPLSSLALDDLGWVQVANFLVSGALIVAGAVGLRRALRRRPGTTGRASTWGPILIGAGGVGLIVAGLFPADPMNGYPVGEADTVTWHGVVHSMGPAVAGLAGLLAYVVFARRFAAELRTSGRDRGWLVWTIVTPLAIIAADVVAFGAGDFRAMLVAQAIGTVWTTALFLKYR